jgi:PIN domain nuclease of toxin-antitoxin system
MRLLLDTNIFVFMVSDRESLSEDVISVIEDPEHLKYLSAESVRELVTAYRSKGLMSDVWHNEGEMVEQILGNPEIAIDYVDAHVLRQLADLEINEAQKHHDPSDHLIIAQAIAHRMTLVSSDTKFPFYRRQGLDLIENER